MDSKIVHSLTLTLLPNLYAVCRLDPAAPIPEWATGDAGAAQGDVVCIMRTPAELSIVCTEANVPDDDTLTERGWRMFRLEGPFPFEMTGVLASVLDPLAQAGVSIFALSTYDTDYVMVKAAQVEQAINAIKNAGHSISQ
jgi:uncharacterized protein